MRTKLYSFIGFIVMATQTIGMNEESPSLEKCRKFEELAKRLKSRIERVETNKPLPADVPMNPEQFNNFKAIHSKVEEELRNCQSAMARNETQPKMMSPTEEENAHKMMLFNNALKRHEDILKKEGEAQKDVSKAVGMKLHAASSNPVLDGELVYEGASKPFKIRDMVKDGIFNLSDPIFSDPTYGDASNHLIITTDPEQFFKVVKNSLKLVMLIAPWSLIHDNLKTSSAPFDPIMKEWDEKIAPIGIFWRMEKWEDLGLYDYLISKDLTSISQINLLENYKSATFVGSSGNRGKAAGTYLPKIHVHFVSSNKDNDNHQE